MRTTRANHLAVLLLLGGLLGQVPALHAQSPASGQRPQTAKTYMNKMVFHLPVLIDNQARASLRELRLYAKEGPDQPWVLKDKAPPSQRLFTYRASQDGEYWFTVVSVDHQGRTIPADVSREEPGVIVVCDTKAPTLNLHLLPAGPEGLVLQCDIRDENLDAFQKRVEYQTADKQWRVLEPIPGRPDQYCIPKQAMFTGYVRLSAVDLAKNTAMQEYNIASLEQPGGAVMANNQMPGGRDEGVRQVQHFSEPTGPIMPTVGGDPVVQPPPENNLQPPAFTPGGGIPLQPEQQGQVTSKFPTQTVGEGVRRPNQAPPRQLINGTHAVLDYQIEKIGPSGVGKVEIWMTADQGQTWKCLGEDLDRKSPAEVDLPGEGVFGVSLAVSNGRGFGGTPPGKGDQPDLWIEVDKTAPTGELLAVRPGAGQDAGAILISWRAQDKNLGATPIELYFATQKDGPWHTIVKGHRNDGLYRWRVPNDVGAAEAYIRLVVIDQAGNRCRCETPQATPLDDHSRPRASVIHVKTGQ
jgi:hypothetical protein